MVHLIFAVKYRKKLLIRYGAEVKQIFYDIAKEKDFEILEMEIDKDHIHVLVRYSPTKSVVDIVKLLKQISTYRIWRQNGNDINLRKHFWKEQTFWSDGYFACSNRSSIHRSHKEVYPRARVKRFILDPKGSRFSRQNFIKRVLGLWGIFS